MKFVLGIILSTILLMSGLGYDVNYAEAAAADAINDLSLQSISKYNNKSDRNSITLTWSAPNDNGGKIKQYVLQVHKTSGVGWTTLDNNIQNPTYTYSNALAGYQFSFRVFALSLDGCVGEGKMQVMEGCNESNILHVVSLPNAERGAPTPQCENKKLDDCGYFADTSSPQKPAEPISPQKPAEPTSPQKPAEPTSPQKPAEPTPVNPTPSSDLEQKKAEVDAYCKANPGKCVSDSLQKSRDSMFTGITVGIIIAVLIGIGILVARIKLYGSFGGGSSDYDDDGYDDDGYDDDRQ